MLKKKKKKYFKNYIHLQKNDQQFIWSQFNYKFQYGNRSLGY
jgi:hypothetical protein